MVVVVLDIHVESCVLMFLQNVLLLIDVGWYINTLDQSLATVKFFYDDAFATKQKYGDGFNPVEST